MGTNKVRFVRNGTIAAVERPSAEVAKVIETELTYEHRKVLKGPAARFSRSKIEITPIQCYKWVEDPDSVFPRRICFPAGYLPRLATALHARGIQTSLRDRQKARNEQRQLFDPQWEHVRPKPHYRYRQREVLRKMVSSKHGGQVICPTGYGKGFLIACACQLLPKAKIDISTHSLDVLEQLYWDISARIPGVGVDSSTFRRQGAGRITLYSGKSLHHSDADADVLIIDEGHEWGTPDYIARLARYRNARRFMFSASPKRADGAHFELEGAFGPPLIEVSYQEAVDNGCIVPIVVDMLDVVMDENPAEGYADTPKERWGIWRNQYRNEVIAKAARELADDEQALITVKTFEHAAFLKKHLPEFTLCYAEGEQTRDDFQRYIGWGLLPKDEPFVDRERRRLLKRRFEKGKLKKVIATTVWNRGVNFRDLSVLIRADASDSAISDTQLPGRTARLPDRTDKKYGRVIDLLDQFDASFRRKGSNRKKRYVENGWRVNLPERMSKLRQQYMF